MASGGSFADIPRHELVAAALELGVERPDRLTAEELAEHIRAASSQSAPPPQREALPSWLSVARNLVASVIEQGLNLPEAARVIRATVRPVPRQRPPLPTVTLAQIYLAQKHADRARTTLEQVLQREPDNFKAQSLVARLNAEQRENEPYPSIYPPPSAPASGARPTFSVTPSSVRGGAPTSDRGHAPTVEAAVSSNLLVLLRCRQSGQLYLYWELSAPSARSPSAARGALGIQLAIFSPSPAGALQRVRWLPTSEPRGVWCIAAGEQVEVRAYLGERLPGGRAKILAVASNHDVPAEPADAAEAVFRPTSRGNYLDASRRALVALRASTLADCPIAPVTHSA
jgi:hypothetical protein